MKRLFNIIFVIFFSFNFFIFNGCKSSYPKEELEERLISLCQKEAKTDIKAFLEGETLYTILALKDVINKDLQLAQTTLDAIQNVILCANRVSISTDADVKFFVVVVYDSIKGVEIVFTQYVEDVRRWLLSNISRSDFFSRSLTDINLHSEGYAFDETKVVNLTLPIFIAKQVVARIKKEMEKNVVIQILMNFEKMDADFKQEDNKSYFEYILYKIEEKEELSDKKIGEMPGIVDLIVSFNKEVCVKYKFNRFDGIIIRTLDEVLYSTI